MILFPCAAMMDPPVRLLSSSESTTYAFLRTLLPAACKPFSTVSARHNPLLRQMTHRIMGRRSIRGTDRRCAMGRDLATADIKTHQRSDRLFLWPAGQIPFHHNMCNNNLTPVSRKTSHVRIRYRLCSHPFKVLGRLQRP